MVLLPWMFCKGLHQISMPRFLAFQRRGDALAGAMPVCGVEGDE
jgi:hypothetical protein